MNTTHLFGRNIIALTQGFRRIVNMGGTSSSKTFSELQIAYILAKRKKKPTTISIVSESLPHLKLGAIRDFNNILRAENDYDENFIHKTENTYHFGNNQVEFFSADITKATGPRRDYLFLNECNNIPYPVISELEMRTNETIFYDFNPTAEFWITDKVFDLPEKERCILKSNYKDNQFLPKSIVKEIELKASRDANFKKVHIDVEFGNNEGLIFPSFHIVDYMPETTRQRIGVDFGFTNDPAVLIDVRLNNGELWADELIYRTGMTNSDIAQFVRSINNSRIDHICDSAEPKSIEELRRFGINATGAVKGTDSIRSGINLIHQYPLNVTRRSVNLIKELRNYQWKVDKSGKSMNEPISVWNHCIDALRYAATAMLTISERRGIRASF